MASATDQLSLNWRGQPPTTTKIRQYESKDQDQVLALFRKGMLSLVPKFTQNMILDPYVFVPVGGVAVLIKIGVTKVLSFFFPVDGKGYSQHNFLISSLPALASTGFVLTSFFFLYSISFNGMDKYVHHSIASDLSDISKHYLTNGGTFLVAEDSLTGRIVGMVAGENKEDDNIVDSSGKFELRRMSVDTPFQRRGLGRQLVHCLEERLRKSGCTHLFLTMSSLQVRPTIQNYYVFHQYH
jgi:GNAT superfamily N-acetyltransferase